MNVNQLSNNPTLVYFNATYSRDQEKQVKLMFIQREQRLNRDYSDSFILCNVAKLSRNRSSINGFQLKTGNEKFTVFLHACSLQTFNLVILR